MRQAVHRDLVFNFSSVAERHQLDELTRQMALAVTEHKRCLSRTLFDDQPLPTVPNIAKYQFADNTDVDLESTAWSVVTRSYYKAIDDFSSTYWRRVDRQLDNSLTKYWRYVEDLAVPAGPECEDRVVDNCAWWMDFPRSVFNSTREGPVEPFWWFRYVIPNGTSYGSRRRLSSTEVIDFWSFLDVVSIESVATWSDVLRQRLANKMYTTQYVQPK